MGVSAAAIAVAIDLVRHGVDWSARDGGVCPRCGAKKCRVVTVRPWSGSTRTRYHCCGQCGEKFKSLEVERAA